MLCTCSCRVRIVRLGYGVRLCCFHYLDRRVWVGVLFVQGLVVRLWYFTAYLGILEGEPNLALLVIGLAVGLNVRMGSAHSKDSFCA